MLPRRSRPRTHGFALASVLAAAIAGCSDSPLAPETRAAVPSGAIAPDVFGLEPVTFEPLPASTARFDFLASNALGTPIAPIPWDADGSSSGWSIVRLQRDPERL